MLMSVPFFGEAHATGITLKEKDQNKLEYLTKSLSSSKYPANKATYLSWMKYFDEDDRKDSQFQLVPSLLAVVLHFSELALGQPA